MNSKKTYLYVLGLGVLISIFISNGVIALPASAEENNVQYPVAELGNCKSKNECKKYCDKPKNLSSCLSFAEKNNLMSDKELKEARKFSEAGGKGPGECANKDDCEKYCDDINHINECVEFAEKTGMLSGEELVEAKQVQSAIAKGVKAPNCKGKKECDIYCEDPNNMKECITFAKEAGFLKGEELEGAEKMLGAIEKGVKPLPCRGREECDNYCSNENHINECITFATAAGFMSEKDAEMAKKTGGKGPGGCRGKEECDAYCENNQEACFNFAKEHGLISEEELKQMEEGNNKFSESLGNMPPEVRKCLEEKFGSIDNLKPNREIGEKMKECFEQFGGPGKGDDMMRFPEEGRTRENFEKRTGPGGCNSREECDAYCKEHQEECMNFGGQRFEGEMAPPFPREGMMPPQRGEEQYKMPPLDRDYQGQFPPNEDRPREFIPNEDSFKQFPPMGTEGQFYPPQGEGSYTTPPSGGGQFPPPGINMPNEGSGNPVGGEPPVSLQTPGEFLLFILANVLFSQ